MLTSKQRAILRGKANTMDPVFIVGKGEIDETMIQGVKDCLDARELIKLKVLESSMYNAREASVKLAEATGADCVQVIGSKFVLYLQKKKDSAYADQVLRTLIHGSGLTLAIRNVYCFTSFSYVLLRLTYYPVNLLAAPEPAPGSNTTISNSPTGNCSTNTCFFGFASLVSSRTMSSSIRPLISVRTRSCTAVRSARDSALNVSSSSRLRISASACA